MNKLKNNLVKSIFSLYNDYFTIFYERGAGSFKKKPAAI